ncbi:MAG: hypothetical protein U1G07_12415 [Verrucomicrobiota bacterium]
MTQFYGYSGATELPSEKEWDPLIGETKVRTWKGRPSAIDAIEADLVSNEIRFHRSSTNPGGYQVIRGFYGPPESHPPDEPLASLWDLDENEFERPLWEAPEVAREMVKLAILAKTVDDALARLGGIKNDLESLVRGRTDSNDPTTGAPRFVPLTMVRFFEIIAAVNTTYFPGGGEAAIKPDVFRRLILDMLQGQEAFISHHTVLRNRKVIGRNSTIRPSSANINKVFVSTAHLIAAENVPNDLPFDLPQGEWMKKGPTRAQIDSNHWQITQEYWWANRWGDLGNPKVTDPAPPP